jgi:beta-lactamase class D
VTTVVTTALLALVALLGSHRGTAPRGASDWRTEAIHRLPAPQETESCFLLYEFDVGEVRRAPSTACGRRVTPASTFKVPHALAALDAGVLQGADSGIAYDGSKYPFPAWDRDHTLASAMRYSVVWYFQRVAERLGEARERQYLQKLRYGNADSSSSLTSFWLGGSLLVSPEEEEKFLVRLYEDALPVSRTAMSTVREILVQPQGMVVNANGEHPFAGPWTDGTILSAKTGSATDRSGRDVRWLVGHVHRGRRSWVFVSCVIGAPELPPLAAVDLAARALHEERVL